MTLQGIPITDDHIHIDPVNGRGVAAALDFYRAGGTHLFLVSKPSWSSGVSPSGGEDFRAVFDATLNTAEKIREIGPVVFCILGVHPAEIGRLCERMPLSRAEEVMKEGLALAARYVEEGSAVGIKTGRPHYPVDPEVWEASNRVLFYALEMARDSGGAVQIHAETGPCADVVEMANRAGMPVTRVVKHFAIEETPLTPSVIARSEEIPAMARSKRIFTMESDYMDENLRPGAVMGPKSVPRTSRRLLESGALSEDDLWRIHSESPERIYHVDITAK